MYIIITEFKRTRTALYIDLLIKLLIYIDTLSDCTLLLTTNNRLILLITIKT